MSTAGQIVGGVVGGIVGAFAGAPMLGASIGMSIGGYIDPPKGPKGNPPSASDLAVQTATYGAPLGDGDGTYGTLGNIFWVEGNSLRAVEHQAEGGGKGGAPTGPSTYDIYGTFAVGFGEGEIDGYGRIWFSSKLVCDYTSSDMGAILATSENGGNITLYTGSMSQLPDDRIQADMGAANTPAYRGLHYIVVKDWPMADFGNSLMGLQVKAEIINDGTISQYARRLYIPDSLLPDTNSYPGAGSTEYGYYNPRVESGVFMCDKASVANGYAYTFGVSYEGALLYRNQGDSVTGVFGYIGSVAAGVVAYTGTYTGTFTVGGADWKLKTADSNNTCHGMAVGADGRIYALERLAGAWLFNIYDGSALTLISSGVNNSIRLGDNNISNPCLPGTNVTFCIEADGTHLWTAQEGGGSASFLLCTISPTGDLATTHAFSETFLGSFARFSAIYAVDGLCYGVNDAGGFYIFDRTRIIQSALVPLADVIERRCLKSRLLDSSNIDVTNITQMVRGYKVSSIAPIRSALEPLQAAWPFDVIQHGYQLKFVPRGNASVATIDISELGCVAGSEKLGIRITTSREMDSQLPRKVLLTYLDVSREYDLNTGPGAERLNTDAVNIEQIELPIVMTATEAAQAEEVLLYLRWLERHDISFVLPPTYANLEAADVVTITGDAATYEVRLTQLNYLPDGRLECSAKFNNVAVYTSVAVAQEGLSPVQVLTYAGPSLLALLDVPCIASTVMNQPGILSATCGFSSPWPGATVFRSDDQGQTWRGVQGVVSPGAAIGAATNVIGTASRYSVDIGSVLSLRMISGALSSVTQDAMLNGANHFAYGAHGRWEIIAAQNCVQQADDSWHLSNLLRGRFGTEQYMNSHSFGDSVVLLDSTALHFIGMDVSSINLTRLWCPVTTGRVFDSAAETALSYTAVNLKPLSGIDFKARRDPNYNLVFDWTRRSRTLVEPLSGMAMPLGETTESYDVEVWGAGYSTLLRTYAALSSSTLTYDADAQYADISAEVENYYLKIYQVSQTVGRGYPLVASGTLSLSSIPDPYWSDVYALMHFNGAEGSTTFVEQKGLSVSVGAGALSITRTGPLFGTGCLNILSSSAISLPGTTLTGDFCLEVSVYMTSGTGQRYLFYIGDESSGRITFFIDGTSLKYDIYGSGGPSLGGTVALNTWQRICFERIGNTLTAYIEGSVVGSATLAGVLGNSNVLRFFTGAVAKYDELRITKHARYSGAYTVAAEQFPNS